MPEVKLTLPDAWVTEWNILFVVAPPHSGWAKMAEFANATLAEWDYPITLDYSSFKKYSEPRWVDPGIIELEQWPRSGYSADPVDGWIKVYRIDLDAMEAS